MWCSVVVPLEVSTFVISRLIGWVCRQYDVLSSLKVRDSGASRLVYFLLLCRGTNFIFHLFCKWIEIFGMILETLVLILSTAVLQIIPYYDYTLFIRLKGPSHFNRIVSKHSLEDFHHNFLAMPVKFYGIGWGRIISLASSLWQHCKA